MKLAPSIREVKWPEVADKVSRVNPELAKIIEEFKNPPPLLLATYPYGANMVDNGVLKIPSKKGQLVPIQHPDIEPKIRGLLDYCSIPSAIYLNTSGEVYIELNGLKISLNVFKPGGVCGLWETLDEPNSQFTRRLWNVSIGAKLVFTLAKLGDINGVKKLEKKFLVKNINVPKNVFEHSELFSHITNSPNNKHAWESEILFFSGDWFKERTNDKTWLKFSYKLLRNEWKQSVYWRNKVTFDLLGQTFASVQSNYNLRPNAYLIDTIMYLISIGSGSSPGFTPVDNSETFAPVSLFQKELIECYGLKQYIPTIMASTSLGPEDFDIPVYYSMQLPSMLGSSPNLRKPHSVLDDMRTIKKLLQALYEFLEKTESPLYDLIKNVSFEFFHPDTDVINNIRSTEEIPIEDKRMIDYPNIKNRKFCASSSFLNGCIRITKRREKPSWD